ncbi:MAG: beta-Ala-His dipeptidase [Planctomycetota bacterium]|nr:beta-Ala-His dipeptidase [Planctomycetota bacterium]MDA1179995.1 beta-Ala-His dipeptidase [Planctomycetota bacterium]
MNASITTPEPAVVWQHFIALNQIARPSKREQAAITFLDQWAQGLGFVTRHDSAGNLVVHVPASHSHSTPPPVILQCHVDMVAITAQPATHGADAARGMIPMVRGDLNAATETMLIPNQAGDWIQAPHTTLGADNGIGVAMMMAIAEADHRPVPLQLLFTVDEEEGMSGAAGLNVAELGLTGNLMINIDTEDDQEITIGAAGGRDARIRWTGDWERQDRSTQCVPYTLKIQELKGGHSGLEINRGRANAIRLLARVLLRLTQSHRVHLLSMQGGTRRNAIPDACAATLLMEPHLEPDYQSIVQICCLEWNRLYAGRDNTIAITLARSPDVQVENALSQLSTMGLARLLAGIPTGICEMTPELPDLVESSCNLAIVQQENSGDAKIACSVRGTTTESLQDVCDSITSVVCLSKGDVEFSDGYPGWKPDLDSSLLKVAAEQYQTVFGAPPRIHAVHAGLECGLLLKKMPGLETISIGPTIKGNHAVGERVQISSVRKSFQYLNAILAKLGAT